MTRLWRSIEDAVTLHGAEKDWRRRLGTEIESFRRFLIPTDEIVGRLAGDDRGGAWLVEKFDGQCYARCERTMVVREVSRADVVSLQFDMRRLSKEVAAALSLAGGVEIVGSTSHIVRAGALPASLKNLPVYVCTLKWTTDLVRAVNLVAHHAGGPFLLLHPTSQPIDSQVRSWLSKVDGHTVALKQLIDVTSDGELAANNRAERLMQQTLGLESADMPATALLVRSGGRSKKSTNACPSWPITFVPTWTSASTACTRPERLSTGNFNSEISPADKLCPARTKVVLPHPRLRDASVRLAAACVFRASRRDTVLFAAVIVATVGELPGREIPFCPTKLLPR